MTLGGSLGLALAKAFMKWVNSSMASASQTLDHELCFLASLISDCFPKPLRGNSVFLLDLLTFKPA